MVWDMYSSSRTQIIKIDIWSGNTKSIFTTVALITKIFKYTKLGIYYI